MPTLGSMPMDKPNLGMRFVWPANPVEHQAKKVTGLATLSVEQLRAEVETPIQGGALVLIADHIPPGPRGRTAEALENLLRRMKTQHAAGLVVLAHPAAHQIYPQSVIDVAHRLNIPLMASSASIDSWNGVNGGIQACRTEFAERQARHLDALMQQLPAQLADPKAMQRIADWLAQSLNAQVLVGEPGQVLAASPVTATEHLAQVIIRQSMQEGDSASPGAHTRLISLAPATGAEAFLAIASPDPLDEADARLIRHAAKLLGLVYQARREYRAVAAASAAARQATVELLMEGEPLKAQRVIAGLAPGLLDADTARVFVLETSASTRDAAVLRCEAATSGRALVIADPNEKRRVVVVHPDRPNAVESSSVAGALIRIVSALGTDASLGGSGLYSLSLLSEAFDEAVMALRFALHQPNSVALSAQETDFISLLPRQAAQRWARQLLHPLMGLPHAQWEQIRETLPTALSYPYTVAARRLDLHRNTVTRRVCRAGELLNVDLAAVPHRSSVSLALELVTRREMASDPAKKDDQDVPSLESLLAAPELSAWSQTILRSVVHDRRDLIATAVTWLKFDAHIEPTARSLGLSEVTVRAHLRAVEGHTSRDLSCLSGIRDLYFALTIHASQAEARAIRAKVEAAA